MIKSLIKKIIPSHTLLTYHKHKSVLASVFHGNPSKKLQIIGITGTKGKSTTANFVWSVLQKNGIETGLIGTANIRMGEKEFPNTSHMTMPGPWEIQSLFAQMLKAGCTTVVMEVTSEGIKQHRNENISFSMGLFTNLSPEHLPSHNNSFEEYKNTKKKFFVQLSQQNVPCIIVNADDEYAPEFLEENITKKITTSLTGKGDINAEIQKVASEETTFRVGDEEYAISIGGDKNVENALMAVAVGKYFNLSPQQIQNGFVSLSTIPGRMERIDEGQKFSVFVDYAHEEKSMNFIADMGRASVQNNGRVIVLLGAEGGGRDPSKRAKMGNIVGQKADIVIVSNVDPYEDDPTPICEDIAIAAEKKGKKRGKDLFVIEDRRKGIEHALQLAKENDIVFITGKGSEQTITIGGKATPWDDRTVVRESLHTL